MLPILGRLFQLAVLFDGLHILWAASIVVIYCPFRLTFKCMINEFHFIVVL